MPGMCYHALLNRSKNTGIEEANGKTLQKWSWINGSRKRITPLRALGFWAKVSLAATSAIFQLQLSHSVCLFIRLIAKHAKPAKATYPYLRRRINPDEDNETLEAVEAMNRSSWERYMARESHPDYSISGLIQVKLLENLAPNLTFCLWAS